MEIFFLDTDSKNAWASVFQEIRNISNNYSYIVKDARKLENKNLNRYRDVNPFDHNRVRLQRSERDYINASLVSVPAANRSYILTQGPLPVTTGHFWLMVWEQKSKAILMLNRVIEKNAVKCHQYWPIGMASGCSDDLCLTDVKLKITFLSQTSKSQYILRKFLLTDLETNDTREVLQFHYTTWPDFGVPESPTEFLNFLFDVRKSGALDNNVGPPVVHCSAGIGRSGTFCLVDSCLVLIEKNCDLNSVNVRQQLLEMRHYRMGLIQTPNQLRFSYLSIIKGSRIVLSNDPENMHSRNKNDSEFNCTSSSTAVCADPKIDFLLDSKDELPPPLPPRTTVTSNDTLNSTHQKIIVGSDCNGETNVKYDFEDTEDVKHSIKLPSADDLLSKEDINDNTSASSENKRYNSIDLRKRARKEREEKTANIVQNILKKQKKTEQWNKRRSIIKLSLGLTLIFIIGLFVYRNCSKS